MTTRRTARLRRIGCTCFMVVGAVLAVAVFTSPALAASPGAAGAPDVDECAGPLSTPRAPAPTGLTHQSAFVDGVQMHFAIGGTGAEAVVLLHGWPQTWYEWVDIMPQLARDYTVIAVDLPGSGDSRGAPRAYDKKTLAEYVHTLVAGTLGYQQVHVVGHDLGGGVALAYAAFYPEAATSLTMMDYPLPGPAFDDQTLQHILWHFGLHMTPQLPEQLVTGRQPQPGTVCQRPAVRP